MKLNRSGSNWNMSHLLPVAVADSKTFPSSWFTSQNSRAVAELVSSSLHPSNFWLYQGALCLSKTKIGAG
jgi:hypothetical protein